MEIVFVLQLFGVATALNFNISSIYPGQRPQVELDDWWGPEHMKTYQDISIRPFEIKFEDEMIRDLRYRLKNHRPFTPPLEDARFHYGFNSDHVEPWLQFWADEYPFKEREIFMNQFPQFVTNIQGLDIHFIWIRPQAEPGVEVIPVLLLHSWMGSVREYYEVLSLVTAMKEGRDFALELIVPSLPGIGFSDGAVRQGFGSAKIAVVMRNLMRRLGYKRFCIQGSDIGTVIASNLATIFPEEVIGFYMNLPWIMTPTNLILQVLGEIHPSTIVDPALANRMYPFMEKAMSLLQEAGYFLQQATKPDTTGISLSDSPSGLLTYILEKFSTTTNTSYRDLPDGGLSGFNKIQILDNLMMYWVPNCMTTAMRFYAEYASRKNFGYGVEAYPSPVPLWTIHAQYEILYNPPPLIKLKYPNLLHSTAMEFGGHMLQFELPELFSVDLIRAVTAFRRWHLEKRDRTFPEQIADNVNYLNRTITELLMKAPARLGVSQLWKYVLCYLEENTGPGGRHRQQNTTNN